MKFVIFVDTTRTFLRIVVLSGVVSRFPMRPNRKSWIIDHYAGTLGNGSLGGFGSIALRLAHRSAVSEFFAASALAFSFYMSPNIPAKVLRRFVIVSSESSPVWLCDWLPCRCRRVRDGGNGGGSSDRRVVAGAVPLTVLD